jgi:hypothetical protein
MVELNQSLLAELGGWPALKEARALVERGKVLEVRRDGAMICARVQGAEKVYDPQITLADRIAKVEVRCTCAESRRSGRVCAHALAAGLAALQPPRVSVSSARKDIASPPQVRLRRMLADDAPPGTPLLELTVLLPLQLMDAFAQDSVRIIIEGRRATDAQPQPFDAILPSVASGFAVSEEDERLLAALERVTGSIAGLNAIPCAKLGPVLRALDFHPRVWLGKKQHIEVRATAERPQLLLRTRDDHSLEVGTRVPSRPIQSGTAGDCCPYLGEATARDKARRVPAWG